jgi:putative transposase
MIRVNGIEDHIHALVELPPRISVAEATGRLKGSSSWFVSDLTREWFAWQNGYAAFTVGKRDLDRVTRYIDRQKQHHRRGTFAAESEPPAATDCS